MSHEQQEKIRGQGENKKKKRGKEGETRAVPTGAQIEIAFKVSAQVGALAHFIMIRSDHAWRETARRRPFRRLASLPIYRKAAERGSRPFCVFGGTVTDWIGARIVPVADPERVAELCNLVTSPRDRLQ